VYLLSSCDRTRTECSFN